MQLHDFLANAAYLYLHDEDFQKTTALAGLDWHQMPDFDPVLAVRKYLTLRASNPHRLVVSQLADDIRYLELQNLQLQKIGRDEEEIGHQLQQAFRIHQYQKLAQNILRDPERAEHFFQQFDVTKLSAAAVKSTSQFLPDAYAQFLANQKEGKSLVVIPGLKDISEMIGGFNPGRLIMLLGETGFGKTNFAMNVAVYAATRHRVLFINMEMDLESITKRLVVLTSRKSFRELNAGNITHHEATKDLHFFGDNLRFTEGYSMSFQTIEALMRRESSEGAKLVIIDYDQKIEFPFSKNVPEWKQLQDATKQLDNLSKELGVCIIMLSQVNREGTISASHRATYSAHTVLNFKSNDSGSVYDKQANAMVSAEKNRHGKKDQACLLHYDESNLTIKEIQVINYKKGGGGVSKIS